MSRPARQLPLGMTEEQHRRRHRELHDALAELVEDYTACAPFGKGRTDLTTVAELVQWSAKQREHPDQPQRHWAGK